MEISFFLPHKKRPQERNGMTQKSYVCTSSTAQTAAALPPALLFFKAEGETSSRSVRGEGGSEEMFITGHTQHTLPSRHKMASEQQEQLSPRQQLWQ